MASILYRRRELKNALIELHKLPSIAMDRQCELLEGDISFKQGEEERALLHWKNALAKDPSFSVARARIAKCMMSHGQTNLAGELLLKDFDVSTINPEIFDLLNSVLKTTDNNDLRERILDKIRSKREISPAFEKDYQAKLDNF